MGLRRQLRLTQAGDFERLRREGRAFRQRLLLVSVLPNQLTHNRYGFITGKRLGNAVVRNRVRRRLREAVRLRHPDLIPGYDLVIVAHPAAVTQPFSSLQNALDDALRQAGLLKP